MAREPFLLGGAAKTLAYDFFNFSAFVLFLALVFLVGGPLRIADRLFGTRLLDGLIRLFESCA